MMRQRKEEEQGWGTLIGCIWCWSLKEKKNIDEAVEHTPAAADPAWLYLGFITQRNSEEHACSSRAQRRRT